MRLYQEQVDVLKEQLLTDRNVLFAYLFGSYATETQTMSSDIDVAVYLRDVTLDMQLQITYELSKIMKKDVDLVVLNSVKNIYLLEEIIKNGVVIKDDTLRFDFELKGQHDVFDFKAFRKYIDAA